MTKKDESSTIEGLKREAEWFRYIKSSIEVNLKQWEKEAKRLKSEKKFLVEINALRKALNDPNPGLGAHKEILQRFNVLNEIRGKFPERMKITDNLDLLVKTHPWILDAVKETLLEKLITEEERILLEKKESKGLKEQERKILEEKKGERELMRDIILRFLQGERIPEARNLTREEYKKLTEEKRRQLNKEAVPVQKVRYKLENLGLKREPFHVIKLISDAETARKFQQNPHEVLAKLRESREKR